MMRVVTIVQQKMKERTKKKLWFRLLVRICIFFQYYSLGQYNGNF